MPGPPLSQAIVRYKGPSKADNKPMRIVSAFVNSRRGGVLMKESICRLLAILSRRNYCLPSESGSIMIFALGWMAGKLIFSSRAEPWAKLAATADGDSACAWCCGKCPESPIWTQLLGAKGKDRRSAAATCGALNLESWVYGARAKGRPAAVPSDSPVPPARGPAPSPRNSTHAASPALFPPCAGCRISR